MSLNVPVYEQQTRRQSNLVSPVTIDADIGGTAATLYTGKDNQSFLIRGLMVHNDTGGAITLVVNTLVPASSAVQRYTASIAAAATTRITALEGLLIAPGTNLTATGENLRVLGWGLRVQGGDAWTL